MKTLLLVAALAIRTQAWAKEWVSPDFYIDHSASFASLQTVAGNPSNESNCRSHISKIMCLVDPAPEQDEPSKPRPCLPGGEAYAHFFEELYDHYPAVLQRVFCSLYTINIEKGFGGTAYGGISKDGQGNIHGALIGIRKSVLDEGLSLSTWATWKEELSFGGVTDSYRATPGLPVIRTSSLSGASDFLYFVVAHEFGHVFDFTNDLNMSGKCTDTNECPVVPGSWGALSWRTDLHALPENEFPDRMGLCFYNCKGKVLQQASIVPLYEGLVDSTNFISTYAATEPWDDFADSLAYFLVARNLGTRYEIDTLQGRSFDVVAKLSSPRFATKYEYIDSFLKRTDIRYP